LTEIREDFERQADAQRAEHEQRIRGMGAQLEDQRQNETDKAEHLIKFNSHVLRMTEKVEWYVTGIRF
jgi:hypothetical protein